MVDLLKNNKKLNHQNINHHQMMIHKKTAVVHNSPTLKNNGPKLKNRGQNGPLAPQLTALGLHSKK